MKDKLVDYFSDRKRNRKKSLAVLVDPDKMDKLSPLLEACRKHVPDLFLVGGSFRGDDMTSGCIRLLKENTEVPVVLFPGNVNQVVKGADAVLLLSVISSRNPDLLIGRHVEAALRVKESGLEIIPTGYILVESGKLTTVQYLSQSLPVPRSKPELAAATALAGEQLGLRAIYLEAGSGADEVVPVQMIAAVRKSIDILLFTGGGITSAENLSNCYAAGTDIAVVGNALETNPELLSYLIRTRDQHNQ